MTLFFAYQVFSSQEKLIINCGESYECEKVIKIIKKLQFKDYSDLKKKLSEQLLSKKYY